MALALLVLLAAAWLPGFLLRKVFGIASGSWGPGALAVDAALSLGLLSLVFLPLYVVGAPVVAAPAVLLLLLALLGATAWRRRGSAAWSLPTKGTAPEWFAFGLAVVLVLPAVLTHAGAAVDDWWDLSFVSGWIAQGHFGFPQMALSPGPGGSPGAHPRFLWNVWLVVQAVVAVATGAAPWRVQAGPLAALVAVLGVSASSALARALFAGHSRASRLAAAIPLATVAWWWGTEALPLFVRGYQDKLVAGFVLGPVLMALLVRASRPSAESEVRRLPLAVALAALATVSVHSLVYTMAAFVGALLVLSNLGRDFPAWLRRHAVVPAALAVAALYPLGQAWVLAHTFGDQGVTLAAADNPVVRAHLALNRMVGTEGPAWVVDPSAVFGSVALLLVPALAMAWRRRREDAARSMLVATLLPCALLFVPGLAGIAGRVWVPWMLYRLAWVLPVVPLVAWFLLEAGRSRSHPRVARFVASAMALAAMLLVLDTAADRLRRDLRDHPGQGTGEPSASAALAYSYLAAQPGRGAVLAAPNFSELVPARSGKPVVAFSERGTLVFSMDEEAAYARLRDRAEFFSSGLSAERRTALAARYGVRWAVVPRRQVASGSEDAWLLRYGAEALLAAQQADRGSCDAGDCAAWWGRTRASLGSALGPAWSVVLETRDHFVVERRDGSGGSRDAEVYARDPAVGGESVRSAGSAAGSTADEPPAWTRPFAPLDSADAAGSHARAGSRSAVLGSAVGSPGATVSYDVPPRFVLPSVAPVWVEGPAAWEDAPSEVELALDLGGPCAVEAVEVLPHLPRARREILEVASGDARVRMPARDGVPLRLVLPPSAARASWTVRVRSLLGMPVSLADVRLLGDPASCAPGWPWVRQARSPQMQASASNLVQLAAQRSDDGRALVALARTLTADDAGAGASLPAARTLLEEATRRDPTLVEAWVALGFAHQAEAASAPDAASRAVHEDAAADAMEAAARADSQSAWAQGCAAWSERGRGYPVRALLRSLGAARLDPGYSDAWTIAAFALDDLHLAGLAENALDRAAAIDPERNWPALARAELALRAGSAARLAAAAGTLRAWLQAHPFDDIAGAKLRVVEAALAAAGNASDARGAI